jgi:hypothetical protein
MSARLPFDIARCKGAGSEEDGEWYWREGCADCLRRTAPGHPEWQVYMSPPQIVAFECESYIEPEAA